MSYVIPVLLLLMLIFALMKKTPVYEVFLSGVKDGLDIAVGIFPPILAILTAVYMLRASGTLDMIISFLSPLSDIIPAQVIPLALIRPLSGSGAVGILTDILNTCGADSHAGRLASVIMGSTETTFYCIAVYFAKTRAKHNLRAVPFALAGDIAGLLIAAAVISRLH